MELISKTAVEKTILTVRDVQVILDRDLASFYEVKPIRLREQVKRNANRFPADFVFQLTTEEIEILVSQNAIPSRQSLGGSLPYVFTEQGVAAVAGILKSEKAAEVSIVIARAFVAMRKFLIQNATVFHRLNYLETKQIETDSKLERMFNALEKEVTPKQGVFFEGQIFDAHVFVSDLIKSAKTSIVLVDNYIDETTLLLLAKRKKRVKCSVHTRLRATFISDLEKYNRQYPKIEAHKNEGSHDRFLLIDNTQLYHFGASLKDLGRSCFAFSRMDQFLLIIQQNLLNHGSTNE